MAGEDGSRRVRPSQQPFPDPHPSPSQGPGADSPLGRSSEVWRYDLPHGEGWSGSEKSGEGPGATPRQPVSGDGTHVRLTFSVRKLCHATVVRLRRERFFDSSFVHEGSVLIYQGRSFKKGTNTHFIPFYSFSSLSPKFKKRNIFQ